MIITFKKLIKILKNIGYELDENINSILDKYIDECVDGYGSNTLSINFSEDTYIVDESKYKYYKSDKFNF